MIRLLKGKIAGKDERSLTVMVQNVGYSVFMPARILEKYSVEPEDSENQFLFHIHTHVREDALQLYGFESASELQLFELFLNVNGIGPRMALQLLSEPVEALVAAMIQEDLAYLCRIPGLGKKTGERLLLELKTKISQLEWAVDPVSKSASNYKNRAEVHPDVFYALENLGYSRRHIEKILQTLPTEVEDPEQLIREFLGRV